MQGIAVTVIMDNFSIQDILLKHFSNPAATNHLIEQDLNGFSS
ncbi:MAG: hypothetical protein AB7T22_08785 [Calditrichaceae bacterium]